MPGSRRSGSPTTSTSGTSRGTRARIRSVSSRSRTASWRRLGPHRPQRGRRRHDRPGCSRSPAARPDSRSSSGPLGREPHALAYDEQPDPRRAAPLVRAGREQRPVALDRPPPQRLRRVHQQRHPGRPARLGDLGHRLHGPHLVVGRLETGQRGVGAQRVRVRRRASPHPSGPPAPRCTDPPLRLVAPRPNGARRSVRPLTRSGDVRRAAARPAPPRSRRARPASRKR